MAQVGNNAARHLMVILPLVIFALRADRMSFALGDVGKMIFDRLDRLQIDERFEAESASVGGYVKNRRLRRAVGERRDRGMQRVYTEFERFKIIERRHAVIAVGMKLQRHIANVFLNEGYQGTRPLGREKPGDVLEADSIGFDRRRPDRKSTRLNSSHLVISYAVFCLKKKKN